MKEKRNKRSGGEWSRSGEVIGKERKGKEKMRRRGSREEQTRGGRKGKRRGGEERKRR